jgi:hypothetical protein
MHLGKNYFTDDIYTKNDLDFKVNEENNNNLYCRLYQNVCQIKGYYDIFNYLIEYQNKSNKFYTYLSYLEKNININEDKVIICELKNIDDFGNKDELYTLQNINK